MVQICGRWVQDGGGFAIPKHIFALTKMEHFFDLACETEGHGDHKVANELLELAIRWDIASRNQVRAVA